MGTPSPAGRRRVGAAGLARAWLGGLGWLAVVVLASCRSAPASDATATRELPGAPEIAERAATAPILGASVSADGTILQLYALPAGPGAATSTAAAPVAGELSAVAERRDSGVEVLLRRPGAAGVAGSAGAGSAGGAGAPAVCRIAHDLHVVRLVLDRPLGDGVVIDAATGVRLAPMVQSQILRPPTLPTGWRLLDEHPLREGERQTGWAQRYGASDAQATLSVVQRRAELGPTERFTVGRDELETLPLRGVQATWSRQGATAASLVWVEAGWEVALSSSSPDGVLPPLDRSTMVEVAASLAPGTAVPTG